MMMQVSFG